MHSPQHLGLILLFKLFPDLENAYKLSEKLKFIYNSKIKKEIAITKLAHWYKGINLKTWGGIYKYFKFVNK